MSRFIVLLRPLLGMLLVVLPLVYSTTNSSAADTTAEAIQDDLLTMVARSSQNVAAAIAETQAISSTKTITSTGTSRLQLPRLRKPATDSSDEEATGDTVDEETSNGSETSEEGEDNTADSQGEDSKATESDTDAETTVAAIQSLEDAHLAIIQIESIGTFKDPEEGQVSSAAGSGSGFIIDESGIAVTNHHVVTGAAFVKVHVAGEDRPRNARILGVSECSDLAVLDIQGQGFPYLDWYEDDIKVGLDVYAAGFPLGDPEYTLTRGIVSKARADGESSWASVAQVLQHDAVINPGNSGGPLIDENGAVVGINYAGDSLTNQYFAISRDDAQVLIEKLRNGIDVDTIGINGQAISDGEQLSGIWVSSVDSGSLADQTGILPGDIILSLEGLPLAEDGTMSTYCNILRSHGPDDVLNIEVLRLDTEEVLEGQLNGRTLVQSFSFAKELVEQSGNADDEESGTPAQTYESYSEVIDASGTLKVELPDAWMDREEGDWIIEEEVVGVRMVAAPDLAAFYENWGIPGIAFSASQSLITEVSVSDLLDAINYSETCTYGERSDYDDSYYTGFYDTWTACGEANSAAIIIAATPENGDHVARVEVYLSGDADFDALDRIRDTFLVSFPQDSTSAESVANPLAEFIDTAGLLYQYEFFADSAANLLAPASWTDTASDDWEVDGDVIGRSFTLSPDLDGFNANWSTPGVDIRTAVDFDEELEAGSLLDAIDQSEICTYQERVEHSHSVYELGYTGAYDIWVNCDGEENIYAVLAAIADDRSHVVLLQFVAIDEADIEAFDIVAQSFFYGDVATVIPQPVLDNKGETTASSFAYTLVSDTSGAITLPVPESWVDISSGDWEVDGDVLGISFNVAPDIERYNSSWNASGLFVGASSEVAQSFTPAELLDVFDYNDECTYSDRFELEDPGFAGQYDIWVNCGEVGTLYVILAMMPQPENDPMLLLTIQLTEDDGVDPLEQILAGFTYDAASTASEEDSQPTASAQSGATMRTVQSASVLVNALNVRTGPGINYGRIGTVRQGATVEIVGQYNNCSWLQINMADGQSGWISGSTQYVSFDVDCEDIPASTDVVRPAETGQAAAPTIPRTNSTQGCYLFQNQLGPEVTVTVTGKENGFANTFKIAGGAEQEQCFSPGKYTYTLDAPPPWGSTNGELEVNAGDRFFFPIQAGE